MGDHLLFPGEVVTGRAVANGSGEAVPDAVVRMARSGGDPRSPVSERRKDLVARTGGRGVFRIDDVPPTGSFSLRVEHAGYLTATDGPRGEPAAQAFRRDLLGKSRQRQLDTTLRSPGVPSLLQTRMNRGL